MPPVDPKYKYHVFISYASADRPWAYKLFKALENQSIEAYLDDSRLQAGDDWNKKLLEGLQASQHIVILWSENSANSDWVNSERYRFEILSEEEPAKRRVIFLLLKGEPRAASHRHMITLLDDANAYTDLADDADSVDQGLWRDTVRKVRDAVLDIENTISVPLILLTTTRDELDQLDPHSQTDIVYPLEQALQHIELGTRDDLMQLYGERREEWRPFGRQEEDIETLLDRLMQVMNNQLADVEFRWEKLGVNFWSQDGRAVKREIERLRGRLSVIVVDPLALYDRRVERRFRMLSDELATSPVLFMTPSPTAMPQTQVYLRELIELLADPVYRRFYEPEIGPGSKASWHCDINIGDEKDVKRTLLAALPKHLVKPEVPKTMRLEPGA